MRIGYLMDSGVPDVREPSPTGAANHVRHTIAELRRLGHQVRLVARFDRQVSVSDDLAQYRPVHVRGVDDGPGRLAERGLRRIQWQFGLPYFAFFDARRFAAACLQELTGFEVLYERMGWMGLGGRRAARRLGIPHVLEVNGDLPAELQMLGFRPGVLQRRVSHRLMGSLARGADHAVATGEGWRARHVERWQVDPARVTVVPNGTSIVDLLERRQLHSFVAGEGDRRPLHVGYVGAFDPWQGLPMLLHATVKALASGANLRVILAGSGRQESELKHMALALGLSDRVTFTGHLALPQLAACLAEWDVGVCLYRGRVEYTGLKLLDYKAAGLATIAAGEGGQPSVIEHGVTGLIIPPDDEAALAATLVETSRRLSQVHEMGRRARMEAEEHHSWRHTAEGIEEVLERVLANRRRRDSPGQGAP